VQNRYVDASPHGHVAKVQPVLLTDTPPIRLYRRAALDEIAATVPAMSDGRARAERRPYLPAETLDISPFAFGETNSPRSAVADALRAEAAGGRESRPAVPAWVLRDVVVHGSFGILTLDDHIIGDTLAHFPQHLIPGSAIEADGQVRLPDHPLSATLPAGFHLLACNLENYFHWLADALSRFEARAFAAMEAEQAAPGGPVLLVPHLDIFWKWETLNLLVPDRVPRIAVAPEGKLAVQRLVYVPGLFGIGPSFAPHSRLLDTFETIAANVLGPFHARAAQPWRRLYIARTDSRNRMLANESEIIALVEQAGFAPVVLGNMPVPEQVRLFAEATHIIAPHGAGLTNIGFCRPGAKLCELQMDSYIHWAFRRLAALRGLAYGCVIGETIEPRHAWPHANTWRIDPESVAAVLRDPRFLNG
jgi:capsular polysaccharide biosynthesis protein